MVVAQSSLSLATARAQFAGGRRYLAAAVTGLPPRESHAAMRDDVDAAFVGRPDVARYTAAVDRTRAHAARLMGVSAWRVAVGSQVSTFAAMIAANLPDGATVLCPEGEFSSMVLPFVHAGRGVGVRTVPLGALAEAVDDDVALVAFSLVQSATGEVADDGAIADAAHRHGARTLCDVTQAAGWLPIDADRHDAVVTHAYKWLCSPRGVAFLALEEGFAAILRPVHAGWYAGEDPWSSCYGPDNVLAADASRLDVSPAWQAFVGAEPAIRLFADLDPEALVSYTTGLAARFRDLVGLGQPRRPSAIVTWPDADGSALARLQAAGMAVSGRAGRARVAFHVFNDQVDVDLAAASVTGMRPTGIG